VPMLLDFGQAHDIKAGKMAAVGGTLRYMPPEQVEGFADGQFTPDRRMDLYALGVMIFELLSGRHPFPESIAIGLPLRPVAAARDEQPPRIRQWNRGVTPAVEAIITKLLQPNPVSRYQTADELVEDLNRQQQNRPLRYAGNPSIQERVCKFRRRHPATAIFMIAVAFALSAMGATGAAVKQAREKANIEAGVQAASVHAALPPLRIDLASPESNRKRDAALAQAKAHFTTYGILNDPKWREHSAIERLSAADRERLFDTFGELAILCALAERMNAAGKPQEKQAAYHKQALEWNRVAEKCFGDRPLPAVIIEQRKQLAKLLANEELGRELTDRDTADEASLDLYLRALTLLTQSKTAEAIAQLEQLTEREPGHAAGQFVLGVCYHASGRYTDASERYQLAKVLSPKDPRPCQNRGLLLLLLQRPKEAAAEFSVALNRDPNFVDAHYHRALAYVHLGRLDAAHEDLTTCVKGSSISFRSLLLQAQLHDRGNNADAAKASRITADKIGPQEEVDYVARGRDRLARKDVIGALEDYAKSTDLNPRYLNGWQNQAHVLGERLQQPEKALDALEKMLELSPNFGPAHAARAVMLARLGKRAEAHAGVARALAASEDPYILYQAACTYALTADAKHPGDRTEAISHLRHAFRAGFKEFTLMETDTDIDAIRKLPEYISAVKSAQELRRK